MCSSFSLVLFGLVLFGIVLSGVAFSGMQVFVSSGDGIM